MSANTDSSGYHQQPLSSTLTSSPSGSDIQQVVSSPPQTEHLLGDVEPKETTDEPYASPFSFLADTLGQEGQPQVTSQDLHPPDLRWQFASEMYGLEEPWLRNGYPLRRDTNARNSLRELILFAILSESHTTIERLELLKEYKASAEEQRVGLPFREILSEPMEPLGVSPLMYEIMSCRPDWDGINDERDGSGLELVHYLIENWQEKVLTRGKMGVCLNVVLTACLRRSDEDDGNRLFQCLRPLVYQSQLKEGQRYPDYDISVTPVGSSARASTRDIHSSDYTFTAIVHLPHFASRFTQPLSTSEVEASLRLGRKPASVSNITSVPVDFLAARRAWRLKVDSNSLVLALIDGPEGPDLDKSFVPLIDARVKVIVPECSGELGKGFASGSASTETPIEFFFPHARLSPVSGTGAGTSEVKISQCFCATPGEYNAVRGLDDGRLLHDRRGALLLELTVHIEHEPSDFSFVSVRNALPQQVASASQTGPGHSEVAQSEFDEDDDLYVSSVVDEHVTRNLTGPGRGDDESEWEQLSQEDETEPKEGGWVKASWSGRDEDL